MDYHRVLRALIRRINRLVDLAISPDIPNRKKLVYIAEIQLLTEIGIKFIRDNHRGLSYALDKQQLDPTPRKPFVADGPKKVRFSRVLTVLN